MNAARKAPDVVIAATTAMANAVTHATSSFQSLRRRATLSALDRRLAAIGCVVGALLLDRVFRLVTLGVRQLDERQPGNEGTMEATPNKRTVRVRVGRSWIGSSRGIAHAQDQERDQARDGGRDDQVPTHAPGRRFESPILVIAEDAYGTEEYRDEDHGRERAYDCPSNNDALPASSSLAFESVETLRPRSHAAARNPPSATAVASVGGILLCTIPLHPEIRDHPASSLPLTRG